MNLPHTKPISQNRSYARKECTTPDLKTEYNKKNNKLSGHRKLKKADRKNLAKDNIKTQMSSYDKIKILKSGDNFSNNIKQSSVEYLSQEKLSNSKTTSKKIVCTTIYKPHGKIGSRNYVHEYTKSTRSGKSDDELSKSYDSSALKSRNTPFKVYHSSRANKSPLNYNVGQSYEEIQRRKKEMKSPGKNHSSSLQKYKKAKMRYQVKKPKNYADAKSGKSKKEEPAQKEEPNDSVVHLAKFINIVKDTPPESEEGASDVEERTPSELNTLGKKTNLPLCNISIHASLQDLTISPSQRSLNKPKNSLLQSKDSFCNSTKNLLTNKTPKNGQSSLQPPSFRRSPTFASTFPKANREIRTESNRTKEVGSEENKASSSNFHELNNNFQTVPESKPDVVQIDFQVQKHRLGNMSQSVQDLSCVNNKPETKFDKRKKTIQSEMTKSGMSRSVFDLETAENYYQKAITAMVSMREEYENLLQKEKDTSGALRDQVKDLQEELARTKYNSIEEHKTQTDKEVQTAGNHIQENSCQTDEIDEYTRSAESEPKIRSLLIAKTANSDQNRIRDMQQELMKLQEQVVQLKLTNKTLKKEGDVKDNKIRHLSAPNQAHLNRTDDHEGYERIYSQTIEEDKNNLTDIDSEEISHESILDFEQQEVIIESVEGSIEVGENRKRTTSYIVKTPSKNDTLSVQEEGKDLIPIEEGDESLIKEPWTPKKQKDSISPAPPRDIPQSSSFTKKSMNTSELNSSRDSELDMVPSSREDSAVYCSSQG
ncbi:unnamed protein product [Moneuplotes crassus]|uniref:Uncharacterized protein n=1 Tax=Euplotes crassus TaxID=5936 RepID=A0AAD1Y2X9_EUPCR|nr:unnamed protein product [Moneuplotes crassus]